MASPSPPLSRAMSQDSTDSDSESDDGFSALPHTPPASRSRLDNPSSSRRAENTQSNTHISSGGLFHQISVNSHQTQGTKKLIDYEEQLKILEMQNKRRLAMARQEQDSIFYPQTNQQVSENETIAAPQTPALDHDSRPSPSSHLLQQHQPASVMMNQARLDQSRLHQARLQLRLQEYSSHKTAQIANEKQNQEASCDFDFDSFLKPNNTQDDWGTGGPSLSAPSYIPASYVPAAWENDRKANLENAVRHQQYIAKQNAAHQVIFATQTANRGPHTIYRTPQALLYQQARTINPQNPQFVSAQTMHSRAQGPPLYHAFQAFGPRKSSYPQPGTTDTGDLPLPPGVKRASSFDHPGNDRVSKKSKPTPDSSDEMGEKNISKSNSIHEHNSPACSPDPNMAESNDSPDRPMRSSETYAMLRRIAKERELQPEVSQAEDIEKEIDAPGEETSKGSPAHSSTTLDDEEERTPLDELEMDVDQENATEMKSTEFDSGISVTTTTFKDGKTMTIMRLGDGSVKGKSKEMRQGVEIVTKTVVIQGVVTTTTTTALIPLSPALGREDTEGGWED